MTAQLNKYCIVFAVALFFTGAIKTFGQPITINTGVDTADSDIKAVSTLWTNYLRSVPNQDNIKNSPYWADTEKKKFSKVDQLLNALHSDYPTYSMGNPTILYVKPKEDFYEIKTLFGGTDSTGNISVLCITSVFAKKENGAYKLYNAFTLNTKQWKAEKLGSVTFHFPPAHPFDKNGAGKLLRSISALTKEWNLPIVPIDYYVADSYEEIEHLRGLDYYVGMGNREKPSGMADPDIKTVFAGGLGENYFHEVVHIYLNNLFPKSQLLDGLAVLYGGSMGHELKWHLARLDDYLNHHPETDLYDLEKFRYMDNFTNPGSTIQGLLCYMAYQKGGLEKLKKLMSYEDTYTAVEKEFGVNRAGINKYLRQQIHANKN